MSLPDGFLDELRSRLSLAQIVGRKVMWDRRRSNQGRGDMWAPCPFHQEKSASFHVDDRKGFYYCFGCHAKGSVFDFVCATENLTFMEAVKRLAQEAGMVLPAGDPAAEARAARKAGLTDVMELAIRFYRMQLGTGAAAAARDYLRRRGLGEPGLQRFEIGFAPGGRRGMTDALLGRGVTEAALVAAGLSARPDDGGPLYDRFRDRIMFPIRDGRGRAIAFGGRAMDPNARAKYLNSPETDLFDKGRSLYNHAPAREAAGKGMPLVVAEGYMDVIALVEAGFAAAVAPLGTAITADQLQLLWRIAPEPVIALDGDTAGLRAAMRVIDVALPLLQPGRSLRFALLPAGKDPDDLIRGEGAGAMRAVLDQARSLVDLLWQRETEDRSFDSPERRAALDARLRELIGRITDPGLRQHYGQAIRDLRWSLFRPARPQGRAPFRKGAPAAMPAKASAAARGSALCRSDESLPERLREAAIVAIVLRNPAVIPRRRDELEDLAFVDPECRRLLDAALACDPSLVGAFPVDVARIAGRGQLENLITDPHLGVNPCIRLPNDPDAAMASLTEELTKLKAARGMREELAEAEADIADEVTRINETGVEPASDAMRWRLYERGEAMSRARRAQVEKDAVFDVAENGARLDRDERDAFRRLVGGLRLGNPDDT